MINKDELLKKIDNSIITEENAIELYTSHLRVILTWSGLSKEKQTEIKDFLDILNYESNEHKGKLAFIRDIVVGEDKNVY